MYTNSVYQALFISPHTQEPGNEVILSAAIDLQ